MKIYIDTVVEEKIDEAVASGLVKGITTTPTFFVRDGVNPHDFYQKIHAKYPQLDLQVELMGDSKEELNKNLEALLQLGISNLTFKTPINPTTIAFAANNKQRFNFHLVYNVNQAIFAAAAGATFICPLLGRLDDNGYDGVTMYRKIKKALAINGFDTQVMASSIRTTNHVTRLFSTTKVDAITLPPDIFKKCLTNLITDNGVALFKKDLQQIK